METTEAQPLTNDNFECIASEAETLAAYLQKFIVPLFRLGQSKHPEQFATGFLVEYKDNSYLVSAAHVLDEVERKDCKIGFPVGLKQFRNLHPVGLMTRLPETQNRSDDKLDVAVLRLVGSGMPPYAEAGRAAMPFEWLLRGPAIGRDIYLLIGFPASKADINRREETQTSAYLPIVAAPASETAFKEQGLRAGDHIGLTWKKRGIRGGGNRRTSPVGMRGMSGAPIFVTLSDHDPAPERGVAVAGILIEHKKQSGGVLVVTKADIARDMILRLSETADSCTSS
ncbi:MAG: hypothetical protein AB7I44_02210 [Hyphomicrobiaceae bacterium]